jgi:hypothetical protein
MSDPAPATDEEFIANGAAVADLMAALQGLPSPDQGEEGISEAASEIKASTKPKRGRPKVFEKMRNDPGTPVGGFTGAKTDRGNQEAEYAYIAARALFARRETHPDVLWVTGILACEDGGQTFGMYGGTRWKAGILAELGRIMCKYSDGEEVAVQYAVALAHMEPRMTVKQAITWIRGQRLPSKRKGSTDALFDAVCKAVDDYWARHPDTPKSAIVEGLESVLGCYSGGAADDETWRTSLPPHEFTDDDDELPEG